MQQATQSIQALPQENPEYEHITTTLYELIEAINEELQPGEEALLGRIVADLTEAQKIQFVGNSPQQQRMEIMAWDIDLWRPGSVRPSSLWTEWENMERFLEVG